MLDALSECLAQVLALPDARVILLEGDFVPGPRVITSQDFFAHALARQLSECEIPTISCLSSATATAGLLLGLNTDFLVLSEDGRYGCLDAGAPSVLEPGAEALFFSRLGRETGTLLLHADSAIDGLTLRNRGCGAPIVALPRLLAHALEMAEGLKLSSRISYRQLKAHFREGVRPHTSSANGIDLTGSRDVDGLQLGNPQP